MVAKYESKYIRITSKMPTNHWTHPNYNKMTRRIEIDSVQGIDIVPT